MVIQHATLQLENKISSKIKDEPYILQRMELMAKKKIDSSTVEN